MRAKARPWRDHVMVFVLLSTRLRREELVNLNLNQLSPSGVEELRQARRAIRRYKQQVINLLLQEIIHLEVTLSDQID